MPATKQDIEEWFDEGVAQKAQHMIVMYDSFDYEDYPVFTITDDECLKRYKNPGEMQHVIEVYDLNTDKAEQINEWRTLRLPKAANVELTDTAIYALFDPDGKMRRCGETLDIVTNYLVEGSGAGLWNALFGKPAETRVKVFELHGWKVLQGTFTPTS